MKDSVPLCNMAPGQRATVQWLLTEGPMRRRFLDMGLMEGTEVECVGRSPWGDPSAYRFCGAVVALRARDSRTILVTP